MYPTETFVDARGFTAHGDLLMGWFKKGDYVLMGIGRDSLCQYLQDKHLKG